MDIRKIQDMKMGWFVGDFDPAAYKTRDFEVGYRIHKKGEQWETHYHEEITEINYLIRGRMTLQNTLLKTGDIFVLKPYEIADPVFLEDCEMIVIKTPSVPGDKRIVE